jgi:hypothetical protein
MTSDQHSALTAMINDAFQAPWSLHFDRDGTEDVVVICDASDDDLAYSRDFWLAEGDDPEIPPTLSAMRLMFSAPKLLAALLLAQRALNTAPRFRVGDTDSYKIAAIVDKAIAEATASQNGGQS